MISLGDEDEDDYHSTNDPLDDISQADLDALDVILKKNESPKVDPVRPGHHADRTKTSVPPTIPKRRLQTARRTNYPGKSYSHKLPIGSRFKGTKGKCRICDFHPNTKIYLGIESCEPCRKFMYLIDKGKNKIPNRCLNERRERCDILKWQGCRYCRLQRCIKVGYRPKLYTTITDPERLQATRATTLAHQQAMRSVVAKRPSMVARDTSPNVSSRGGSDAELSSKCYVCGSTKLRQRALNICQSCVCFYEYYHNRVNGLTRDCVTGQRECVINVDTRKKCPFCRYQKCLKVMSRSESSVEESSSGPDRPHVNRRGSSSSATLDTSARPDRCKICSNPVAIVASQSIYTCRACYAFHLKLRKRDPKRRSLECRTGRNDCKIDYRYGYMCGYCRLQKGIKLGWPDPWKPETLEQKIYTTKRQIIQIPAQQSPKIHENTTTKVLIPKVPKHQTPKAPERQETKVQEPKATKVTEQQAAEVSQRPVPKAAEEPAPKMSGPRGGVKPSRSSQGDKIRVKQSSVQSTCKICTDTRSVAEKQGIAMCRFCRNFLVRARKHGSIVECSTKRYDCQIDKKNRNDCDFCRAQKAFAVGYPTTLFDLRRLKICDECEIHYQSIAANKQATLKECSSEHCDCKKRSHCNFCRFTAGCNKVSEQLQNSRNAGATDIEMIAQMQDNPRGPESGRESSSTEISESLQRSPENCQDEPKTASSASATTTTVATSVVESSGSDVVMTTTDQVKEGFESSRFYDPLEAFRPGSLTKKSPLDAPAAGRKQKKKNRLKPNLIINANLDLTLLGPQFGVIRDRNVEPTEINTIETFAFDVSRSDGPTMVEDATNELRPDHLTDHINRLNNYDSDGGHNTTTITMTLELRRTIIDRRPMMLKKERASQIFDEVQSTSLIAPEEDCDIYDASEILEIDCDA